MINIGLVGANGRMGLKVVEQIKIKNNLFHLKSAVVHDINKIDDLIIKTADNYSNDLSILYHVDVVVDFSSPKVLYELLPICIDKKLPIIICTTGFDDELIKLIENSAKVIPIVVAPNTSLSVNLMFKLVDLMASVLNNFEVEIIEAHHRNKKDAPSGTAIKIGEIISRARNTDFMKVAKFARYGTSEIRNKDDIGFAVVRGGNNIGMHEVQFINDNENLSIRSEINNRECFATGALLASKFILNKKAGLYSMLDVLDI